MPTTPTGIGYDRAGDPGRPTVLLVHAGVADRRMWDPQWEAVAAEHDVLRLDLRGFGDSDTPPDGPLDPVADVLDLLDRLGEVAAPTTVVIGAHDLEATRDAADRVVRGVLGARRVDWPDVAHLPSLERPERFTRLLREHLAAAEA